MSGIGFTVRSLTLGEVRQVYRDCMLDDFPDNERKPLALIERALRRGEYECFGAFGRDGILAYAFLVRMGEECLFDYLAVKREFRGSGIGSAFLGELKEHLGEFGCVLLESDDPDFAPDEAERAVRERRLRFYRHNGLRDTGVRTRVFGADYRILEVLTAREHTPDEVGEAYKRLYRSFIPGPIFGSAVKVRG